MVASDLITLRNAKLEVGIVPALGGRVVRLRRIDGTNLIYAPESLWMNWRTTRPAPDSYPVWQAYFGHITWLGPQSEFWNQQELFPEKHGDIWPPDPSQIYGDFEIITQSPTTLRLRGPASPVTGMQLEKQFEVSGSQVHLSVTATNRRDSAVSWDLWSNTRISPHVPSIAPVGNRTAVRMVKVKGEPLPWSVDDGGFRFHASPRSPDSHVKAFISASAPWIASLHPDALLVKSFASTPPQRIHPEQALIEIYLATPSTESDGLQELEFHGPFTSLAPGASMTQEESWTVLPRPSLAADQWMAMHRIKSSL